MIQRNVMIGLLDVFMKSVKGLLPGPPNPLPFFVSVFFSDDFPKISSHLEAYDFDEPHPLSAGLNAMSVECNLLLLLLLLEDESDDAAESQNRATPRLDLYI